MHLHQYVNVTLSNLLCHLACADPCLSIFWAAASLAASVYGKKLPPSKWLPPLSQWGRPQQFPGQQTRPCHQSGHQTALCTNESNTIYFSRQTRIRYDLLQIRNVFHFWRNRISRNFVNVCFMAVKVIKSKLTLFFGKNGCKKDRNSKYFIKRDVFISHVIRD